MNEETEAQGGWLACARPRVQVEPTSRLWFSQPLMVNAPQLLKLAYSTSEVCLGDKWGDARGLALCFGVGECFAFLGQATSHRPPPPPQESRSGAECCGHRLLIQHRALSAVWHPESTVQRQRCLSYCFFKKLGLSHSRNINGFHRL